MIRALNMGRTLVVDRYAYSGAAFTAAKQLPGLDLEWCKVLPCALCAMCSSGEHVHLVEQFCLLHA
jgi:thymidylate kinase